MASSYWSKDWYLEFSANLAANVAANPKLLGVVLVGSTSDTSRVDEWSDHDFFLITQEGEGEAFRQDLSWLPLVSEIAWAVRETAHGLKVVYNFGHVLEFAVFNDSELELAKVNAATVAADKSALTARVDALREASKPTVVANLNSELELLLSHILIGVGRYRRGEVLIAGEQIRSYLMGNLLTLTSHWAAPMPGSEATEDNLNRFRRFERRYPEQAERIATALAGDVESAARGILELVEEIDPAEDNRDKYRVVRNRLGWN
jgi:hypothetical protein